MDLNISCAAESEKGRRSDNDDAVLADGENGLYVVCDGVSTRIGGRTAAELACQALGRQMPDLSERLGRSLAANASQLAEAAIQGAHEAILEAQSHSAELSEMTTTLAMVLQRGNKLLCSHVGDSRVYLYRAPELRQMTRDHSLENYLRDNPQVRPKVKRPGKTLVRALGLRASKLGTEHGQVDIERGDVILICTDGLTDSVPQWTLREILAGVRFLSVRETARCLVRAALSHGSMDNVSVMLLHATDRVEAGSRTVLYDLEADGGDAAVVLGWLTFLDGSRRGEVFDLKASTVVGADPRCRIVVEGDFVSSRHLEILAEEHGFLLRDLGSTNGTYVNDVKITEAVLVDGDVVRVGKTPVVFKSHRLER